jgi:hypothetical protein
LLSSIRRTTLERTCRTFSGVLVLIACAGARPPRAIAESHRDLVLHEFEIRKNRFILVPVKVAGRSVMAVLDTGSTYSVYDRKMRGVLGEERAGIEVDTPLGRFCQQQFEGPPIVAGRTRLSHGGGPVGCADLENMRLASGQRFEMVLGMDALSGVVIRLDFRTGRGSFLRDCECSCASVTPLEWGGGTLWAAVSGARLPATWFKIDTAFIYPGFGSLDSALFESLQDAGLLRDVAERGVGSVPDVRGSIHVFTARYASHLSMGAHNYDGAEFLKAQGNSIGLGFLSHYVATIDCQRRRLFLQHDAACHTRPPTEHPDGARTNTRTQAMGRRARVLRKNAGDWILSCADPKNGRRSEKRIRKTGESPVIGKEKRK